MRCWSFTIGSHLLSLALIILLTLIKVRPKVFEITKFPDSSPKMVCKTLRKKTHFQTIQKIPKGNNGNTHGHLYEHFQCYNKPWTVYKEYKNLHQALLYHVLMIDKFTSLDLMKIIHIFLQTAFILTIFTLLSSQWLESIALPLWHDFC